MEYDGIHSSSKVKIQSSGRPKEPAHSFQKKGQDTPNGYNFVLLPEITLYVKADFL